MYKHLYSRFLAAHPEQLHFAAHSHHYWPDVTRDAQLQYWDDTCDHVDDKWPFIFSEKVPRAQRLIARHLDLQHPEQIIFSPSTHEFVFRLLSSMDWTQKVRVLTTDSEFYSFDRQISRLQELPFFEVVKVPVQPFATFHERFEKEMNQGSFQMIFLSHVFFNSGLVVDIHRLARQASLKTPFMIDGYHGFMAVPTSLKDLEGRVFYVAGSYKYAQGGEGACFLVVPEGSRHRPFYTGWYAEFSKLQAVGSQIGYPTDAFQYAGSTMDYTAVYRLIAVLEKWQQEQITVEKVHAHIRKMQQLFLQLLATKNHPLLNMRSLLCAGEDATLPCHGHFLTFELPSTEETVQMVETLKKKGLMTDSRARRLRFGFGMYHDEAAVKEAVSKI